MIVYKTSSILQRLLFSILKAGYLACAGIALFHYQENPIVVLIVVFICVLFFLITGTDEIQVYSHYFKFIQHTPFKIFYKQRTFFIPEIETINIKGNYGTGDELSVPSGGKDEPLNELQIILIDGSEYNFTTSIYLNKLNKAVETIMQLRGTAIKR